MVSEVSTQLLWPSLSLQTRNLKLLKESLAIGVFIDLKRAIDSIKNSILLDKLNFYGVRGISLSWFQDDPNSRCQFLELANCRPSLLFVLKFWHYCRVSIKKLLLILNQSFANTNRTKSTPCPCWSRN